MNGSALQKKVSIGIIIPALNEGNSIRRTLSRITSELSNADYSICIVDDGSRDETVPIITEMMRDNERIHLIQRVKTKPGCQRGGASLCGMKWMLENTSHAMFAEVDADGAHRPEELLRGAHCIKELDFDVAIASKYSYGSRVVGRAWTRRLISLFYSMLARVLIDFKLRDYSNSYRFYSRKAAICAMNQNLRYTTPIYLLEILVVWISNDMRIIEVPTLYEERGKGDSKVIFADLIKAFFGIMVIAWRYHFKRYQSLDGEKRGKAAS